MKDRKFDHVIWDWNGTLLNDVELCINIINKILVSCNQKELTYTSYREVFTFPVRDYYEKAGIDFNIYSFKELGKVFIDEYEERKIEACLYNGAKEILEYFSRTGVQQSVLSAYFQENLNEIINSYSLSKYFVKLVGLDNVYAGSKLDKGRKWIKELGLDPSRVLFVGDTIHDYEVATAMEVKSVLLSQGHQSTQRLEATGATVFDGLEALLEWIKK